MNKQEATDKEYYHASNKEIALFAGSMLVREYHSSWDEIMPVVKKIQRLEILEFSRKKPVMNALIDVDIKMLFNQVAAFAIWYNRLTKETEENGK